MSSLSIGEQSTCVVSRTVRLANGFRGTITGNATLLDVIVDANATATLNCVVGALALSSGAKHELRSGNVSLNALVVARNATLTVRAPTTITLNSTLINEGSVRVVESLVVRGALNQVCENRHEIINCGVKYLKRYMLFF